MDKTTVYFILEANSKFLSWFGYKKNTTNYALHGKKNRKQFSDLKMYKR